MNIFNFLERVVMIRNKKIIVFFCILFFAADIKPAAEDSVVNDAVARLMSVANNLEGESLRLFTIFTVCYQGSDILSVFYKSSLLNQMTRNFKEALADNSEEQKIFQSMFTQTKINTALYQQAAFLSLVLFFLPIPNNSVWSSYIKLLGVWFSAFLHRKVYSFNEKCAYETAKIINEYQGIHKKPKISIYANLSSHQIFNMQ